MRFRFCLLLILLALFVLSVATVTAQDEPGLCTPRAERELVNFGQIWKSWTDSVRSIYLEGFVDGQSHTYLLLQGDVPAARREPLRLMTFTFYGGAAIRDVMTSLYADPANTFVEFEDMVYIARDKLSGKDIEPALRDARRSSCAFTK